MLGGATTQGTSPLPGTRSPRSSYFVIPAPSPEIVPGAGVRASGVGPDGLMRGPQAEDPDLAVIAPVGSGEETRAEVRSHTPNLVWLQPSKPPGCEHAPRHQRHTRGQAGVQAGRVGEGRTLSRRPSHG